jgi:hypothetical protein
MDLQNRGLIPPILLCVKQVSKLQRRGAVPVFGTHRSVQAAKLDRVCGDVECSRR